MGKPLRHRCAAFIAVLLLGFATFSRGKTGSIVLTVQGLPDQSAMDPEAVAEQRVVARFLETRPQVEIRRAEGLRIENLNSEAITMMMIAGGIAPDIIRMNFRSSETYIRQGIVAPLESFLKDGSEQSVLAAVPPQILPVVERTGPDGEKHLYGLPTRMMVSGIYFNKEVFRKAGLPIRAPHDWKEMAEFARKIQALGPPYYGLVLPAGASAGFHLMNFLRGSGADAVTENAPGQWRAAFNSTEAVDAYLFYYQLVEAERIAHRPNGDPTSSEMAAVGMLFRYAGSTVRLDPQNWGFGSVPKGHGGHGGSEINAEILAMFSGIKDAQRRQAAWDYLLFMTSEEAERIRIMTLIELGQASTVNPAILRKFGFEEYLILAQTGLDEEIKTAVENGKPEPYGRNCNLIYLELTYPLDQILLSKTIHRAWKQGDMESVRGEVQMILDEAVRKTNQRLIGYVPAESMRFRRIVTGFVIAGIFSAFIAVGVYVARSFLSASKGAPRPVVSRTLIPWLCLFPALALTIVWEYVPFFRGTIIAFQNYQVFLPSAFVGLDNFANTLFNMEFWNSIYVTLYFTLLQLTFGFAAPILLAYLLHLIPKHRMLFRTIYYLPAVISGTAVFFLWKALFDGEGILNQLLRIMGLDATRAWTQDPHLAMLTCVIPGIWATMGPGCLIYLAALKTIPEEQFEAAEIDGAGFWRKTVDVVYPGLKALIVINFIGAAVAALQTSANVLIMTGGGPNGATTVTALLIFYEAFTRLNFGTATAMAWVVGSMLLGFTVLQLQHLSRMEFKTAK